MIGAILVLILEDKATRRLLILWIQEPYSKYKNGQKFSLQGTASYAKSGQSMTDIFGQISDGQSLVTVIFNQSGYLAGISFEGTYISVKK